MKTFEDDPGLITESRRMGKPPMRWIQEIQQESLKGEAHWKKPERSTNQPEHPNDPEDKTF